MTYFGISALLCGRASTHGYDPGRHCTADPNITVMDMDMAQDQARCCKNTPATVLSLGLNVNLGMEKRKAMVLDRGLVCSSHHKIPLNSLSTFPNSRIQLSQTCVTILSVPRVSRARQLWRGKRAFSGSTPVRWFSWKPFPT